MTEATSEGQALDQGVPGAAAPKYQTEPSSGSSDALNAAIAATAGVVEPPMQTRGITAGEVDALISEHLASPEQNAAAMQAYIDEGVRHATGHFGEATVVSVAAFREALGKLMEHLHLDHPENYLTK